METRFPQWETGPQIAADGIIVLGGESVERITVLAELHRRFPQARLFYNGRTAQGQEFLTRFSRLGGDPGRLTTEAQSPDRNNDGYGAEQGPQVLSERQLPVTRTRSANGDLGEARPGANRNEGTKGACVRRSAAHRQFERQLAAGLCSSDILWLFIHARYVGSLEALQFAVTARESSVFGRNEGLSCLGREAKTFVGLLAVSLCYAVRVRHGLPAIWRS